MLQKRDRLFSMLIEEGGLISAVRSLTRLHIATQRGRFGSHEITASQRRLLDDNDENDSKVLPI